MSDEHKKPSEEPGSGEKELQKPKDQPDEIELDQEAPPDETDEFKELLVHSAAEMMHGQKDSDSQVQQTSGVELSDDDEGLKERLLLEPKERDYYEIELEIPPDEGSGIELVEEPRFREETEQKLVQQTADRISLKLAALLFLIALIGLSLFAWDRTWRRSDHPHYVYLADAFLHGRLYIAKPPPWMDDYVWFENKWWVTFPPFPAVAMLPGVAACEKLGLDQIPIVKQVVCGVPKHPLQGHPYFNDTLFTIIFGALNALLMWLLLERLRIYGISGRTRKENLWLWVLFTFGSAALYCSVLGQVWYTALVMGATMLLLYIHFAWNAEHPFWAGLFLVLGFACRPPIAMAFPLFFYFLFFRNNERIYRSWREILVKTALFVLPIVLVLVLIGIHNYVRFHNPFEFGHDYIMKDRHVRHGMFGYAWLARNLAAALINLPRIVDKFPYVKFSFHGTSILFTSPAFIFVFWPKKMSQLYKIFAITAILVALPSLLYKSTGFGQFGYRYSLDYTAFLVAMLAIGGRRLGLLFKTLILVSVFWNSLGAIVFRRWDDLFFHFDFWPETPFSRE